MFSRETSRKIKKKPVPPPEKLPMYGPLDIKRTSVFFTNCKERFDEYYNCAFTLTISTSDFQMLNNIGQGAFGAVKLVKKLETNTYLAVKTIKKRQVVELKAISHALNEKKILQSLDFPFGVRLEYFSQDRSYLYFFMPFVSGGELFNYLRESKKLSETVSCFYAAQVVLALEYFQRIRLVHRDIKPENILLDHHGFLKIVDYGLAKLVETRTYTFCGTPHYLAPEIIQGIGYAASVDWWALGILIFELNTGRPPFKNKDHTKLFTRILYDKLPIPSSFSQSLQSLLRSLLQRDVSRRLGILQKGAEDAKCHDWFKHINWLELFNRRTKPPYIPKLDGEDDCAHFPEAKRSSSLKMRESDQFSELFKDF